ncbi:hypothetical protein [Pedobacter suwonensis]|uniref:hypothetical protein n=1 Tax=Pedobacter suwonensis TaxID=332999 RepID=UPI0011A3770D|nr:hypothetical protein [Pedobacter suwonensis]
MHKPKTQNNNKISLDTIVGLCAIVTSICAIIITLYQTRLQKVQQYASVKPLLMNYSQSFSGGDGKNGKSYHYEFIIVNQGLGPAIVSNYSYSYNSKRFENIAEILQQIKKENRLDSTKSVALANIWKNEILPVGEKLSLINIDDDRLAPLVEKADIKITIEYKSLYGQEWRFISNDKSEPQEID